MRSVKRGIAITMAMVLMATGGVFTNLEHRQVVAAATYAEGSTVMEGGYIGKVKSATEKTAILLGTTWGRYAGISAELPSSIEGYTITEIADDAFDSTNKRTLLFNSSILTIPDTVKKIGNNAFKACERIKSVVIGKSVTSIGTNVFQGCSSLTTVAINSNCSVGSGAFGSNVKTVYYNPLCTNISSKIPGTGVSYSKIPTGYSARIADEYIYYLDGSGKVTYGLPTDQTALSYTVPEDINGQPVYGLAEGAFRGMSITGTVYFNNQLEVIGKEAFKNTTIRYYANVSQIYLKINTHVTKIEDRAFEGFAGQSYMYIYGNPEFGADVFKGSSIKKLYCYSFASNVKKYCENNNLQYEVIPGPEQLTVKAGARKDGRMEVYTSGSDPQQVVKVSEYQNKDVTGFNVYYGGTSSDKLESRVSFTGKENGLKTGEYMAKHPGKYYFRAVENGMEVGNFYSLEFSKVMISYPFNSISYALFEKSTMASEIIDYFTNNYTVSNTIYCNEVEGLYLTSDFSKKLTGAVGAPGTLYLRYKLAHNLGYSFCNSSYDFNYSSTYQIPLHSYEIIFGQTALAKQLKESNDKQWIVDNNGHYETKYWWGNCSGMTTTASMIHMRDDNLDIFDFSNVSYSADLKVTTNNKKMNESLTTIIEAMQVGQVAFSLDRVYGPENVRSIVSSETSKRNTVYLSIGDHALLAYYYDKQNDRIRVLDPNYPRNPNKYIQLSKTDKDFWHYDSKHGSDITTTGNGDYNSMNGSSTSENNYNKKLACVKFDAYNNVWKKRGTVTTGRSYLNANSMNFTIYDADGSMVAKIRDGAMVTGSKKVSMIHLDDGQYMGTQLWIDDDDITVVNDDKSIKEFECNFADVDNAASVVTQADEISFNVDDETNTNDVTVDTDEGDSYKIVLNSTDDKENEKVVVSGKGLDQDVNVGQHRGKVTRRNCPKSKYSVKR